jgi:hypothetical protein
LASRGWNGPYLSRSNRVDEAETTPDETVLRLEAALPLKGWAIKVAGRGTSRQARDKEANSLLIGALATVAQNFGVQTLNLTKSNGQPMALAIIEDARFGEEYGETILTHRKEDEQNEG